MSVLCVDVSNDKLKPDTTLLEQMKLVALECEKAAIQRKQDESALSLQRRNPLTSTEMDKLYSFLTHCLMYRLFGSEWTKLDVNSPNYDLMTKYFDITDKAMKMLRIQQAFSNASEFEESVMNLFDSIIVRFNREKDSRQCYHIASTLFSIASYVIPMVAAIPVPVVVVGVGLIRAHGFIGAAEVAVGAGKLGINTLDISMNALAWGVNTSVKLLKL